MADDIDDVAAAFLACGPLWANKHLSLPLGRYLKLCKNPEIRQRGEKVILQAIEDLTCGKEIDDRLSDAVWWWASRRRNSLQQKKTSKGRQCNFENAMVVALAYREKIRTQGSEAALSELMAETGLGRRRILAMVALVRAAAFDDTVFDAFDPQAPTGIN
jgi:hypothetical protein